jgi:hypothetical protein
MRPARMMMACAVAWILAVIIVVSLATALAHRGSTGASLRPAASVAAGAALPRAAIPGCRRSQLVAGGLGVSAAAGTAIVTIRVTNVSPRSCHLEGRPSVAFLDAAGRALRVAVSTMTWVHGAVVALVPQTGPLRPYAPLGDSPTAGFVVTTADDMVTGEPCGAVAALRIVLPSVPGSFTVGGLSSPDYRYSVCESSAAVSPMAVAALIDGYAPAFPACLASQLDASVAVRANSASGTRLVVTVTNHTAAICTIDGYPDARLTGSSGQAVLGYQAGRANALLPTPATSRPVTLIDGGSASAVLATAAPNPRGWPCQAWSALSVALFADSGALRINRTFYVCGADPGAGAFVAGS